MEQVPVSKKEKTREEYNPSSISEGYHSTSLEHELRIVAQEVNEELERLGLGDLVDDECRIRPDTYRGEFNFPEKKLREDEEYVYQKEMGFVWQDALRTIEQRKGGSYSMDERKMRAIVERDKEEVSYHYYQAYGATTSEEIRAVWHKERLQGLAEGLEMLVTALFHKAFGNEFIIVRSSTYDDYVHGIDTVMIDKKTGEFVCAFDELHEFGADDRRREESKKRSSEKRQRIETMNKEGGSTLAYGVVKGENGFQRKSIPHVPVLCLSLETKPLIATLHEFTLEGDLSQEEERLCRDIVMSLLEQAKHMEDAVRSEEERRAEETGMHIPIEGVPVRQHLQSAQHSLRHMLEIIPSSQVR
ncbi:MAG: hypothetical protein HGA67_01540 [Candidatus Yonathbacteria bacterium]|nr:hypothetical protein [Candidatus Yonathbacteria bacterium]